MAGTVLVIGDIAMSISGERILDFHSSGRKQLIRK